MTPADPFALLRSAHQRGHGLGAFNVIQLEHAEALVAGARAVDAPLVLQISQNTVRYHGALAPLGSAVLAIARACEVPAVVHLDHAEDPALVREAVALGCTSVMYDGSRLSYADNVRATKSIVDECHDRGVAVEAELGEIGGKDGAHAPGVRTDPDEAAEFVAATGVDSLAVAAGTSHAMTSRDAVVDLELIAVLRAAVEVPLVLHGSSGVSDVDLGRAVAAGLTKVNIATRVNGVLTDVVRRRLAGDPAVTDPRAYLGPAREAVAAETAHLLRCLGAAGTPA